MEEDNLENLKNYAKLCESRILELSPSHPMPVSQKHLGSQSQTQSAQFSSSHSFPAPSTHLTHQQLFDLYSALYQKQKEIARDTQELETSLKGEMLLCEEQRAYIDMLRNSLEIKIEDMGISGDVDGYVDLVQTHDESEQNRKDAAKLSGIVQDQEAQLNRLVEKYGNLEAENDALKQITEEFQQKLGSKKEKNSAAKVQMIANNDEIEKLNANKNQLEEDLDRNISNVKRSTEDLKLLREKNNSLTSQISQAEDQSSKLRAEIESYQTQLDGLREEAKEKDSVIEAAKSTIQDLCNEAKLKDDENGDLNNKMKHNESMAESDKDKLRTEVTALNNEVSRQVQELQTAKSKALSSTEDLNLQTQLVEQLKKEKEELYKRILSSAEQGASLETKLKERDHQLFESLRIKENLQKDINELHERHRITTDRLSQIEVEREDMRSTLTISEARSAEIKSHLNLITNETEQRLQAQGDDMAQTRLQLNHTLNSQVETERMLQEARTSVLELTDETVILRRQLTDAEGRISGMNDLHYSARIEAQGVQQELDSLRNQVSRVLSDLELMASPTVSLDASARGQDPIFVIESYTNGLCAELRTAQAHGDGASKNAQNLTDEIILLQRKLTESESTTNRLQTSYDSVKLDVGDLRTELETLKAKSNCVERDLILEAKCLIDVSSIPQYGEMSIDAIQAYSMSLCKALRESQQDKITKVQHQTLEADLNQAKQEINMLRRTINEQVSEGSHWKQRSLKTDEITKEQENQIRSLVAKNKQLEGMVNQIKLNAPTQESKKMISQMVTKRRELADIETERMELQAELDQDKATDRYSHNRYTSGVGLHIPTD